MLRRLAGLVLLAAVPTVAVADGPAASGVRPSWAWLEASTAGPNEAKTSPGLTPEEAEVGKQAVMAVVAVVVTPEGGTPSDERISATGFFVEKDGVFATTWRALATVGPDSWLWAKPKGGEWTRAIPTGSTWLGDVGLARLVTKRRNFPTLAFAEGEKKLGTRFLAVGCALGKTSVVSVGTLSASIWFDATQPNGRLEMRRTGPTKTLGKGALPIGLHLSDDLSTVGGTGSPVLNAEGKCVAMIAAGDPSRPAPEMTYARPAELIRPLIDRMKEDAIWNPPDLGLRFGPPPSPWGAPLSLPPEIERVRKKDKGGALVTDVAVAGPAQSIVWEGDVVLEINKHPLFGDVYESLIPVILSLPLGGPADVVLFRGGKRQTVSVTPHWGREIYGDFNEESDKRAGSLRPR